jgi:zinc transport system ATP-binding protein
MTLIELKNLSLGYDNHIVLKDINMTIEENDFICIVGPNGSGKSTLIKGILGLIKASKGKVIYHNLKQNFIGYMPQETRVDSNFPASVFEIVLSGTLNRLGLKSFYTRKEKQIALDNLKILGIENLKDKNFCDLSGGGRQKVLLARSLCATSKLLILDEPSNNLDSKSKQELYRTIIDLNKNHNITIIMITHDLDHDNLIGNKILSLREDEAFFGRTEDFIKKVHHE